MKKLFNNYNGFSMVEIIVAIGLSSLLLLYLTRLFTTSLKGSDLQEQLTDINQNAKFTIKELGDVLMQAGADLQLVNMGAAEKDTVIKPDGGSATCNGFTIKVNPGGGIFMIPQNLSPAVCSIQVENASLFRYAPKIQRISNVNSKLALKFYTITRYDCVSNYVVFSPADSFLQHDVICSYVNNHYYLVSSNLCLNNDTNVIAENIDSLSITFLNQSGEPTSKWPEMRSVKLRVCAKTPLADNKYKGYADHHRRVLLTHEFRLRNKVEIRTR